MKRTLQQQNFIDAVRIAAAAGGGQNFCLRARAGTGKSSTMVELVDDYTLDWPSNEVTLCAFNRAAAADLKAKLTEHGHTDWRKVAASTVHSLGNGLVRFVFKSTLNEYKVRDLIRLQNGMVYQEYGNLIRSLVSYAKLEGFGFFGDVQVGDTSAWYRMAEHYDVNGFEDDTTDLDAVVAAAQKIYELSANETSVIDYDDMILYPLTKNLRVRFQKDLLIVDEAQDTGRARQALLKKFVKRQGIMIVVGDDRQGIYGFAGAQANALELLIEDLNMKVLPLTVSWRCPISVILEAQKLVPDIEHAPEAAQGTVARANALPEAFEKTDAILCRNTAPLVEVAYSLLRRGIACRVEGREIGNGLLRMVNRWKVSTISAFLDKLEDYRARETQKAIARGSEAKVAEIEDRCDTLVHLANVCIDRRQTELQALRDFIDSIFGDDVSGVVTLCTYHRSKGREWPRVFLLEHHRRCPSRWAKQAWQLHQEHNLAYVAITRSQQVLTYVDREEAVR